MSILCLLMCASHLSEAKWIHTLTEKNPPKKTTTVYTLFQTNSWNRFGNGCSLWIYFPPVLRLIPPPCPTAALWLDSSQLEQSAIQSCFLHVLAELLWNTSYQPKSRFSRPSTVWLLVCDLVRDDPNKIFSESLELFDMFSMLDYTTTIDFLI